MKKILLVFVLAFTSVSFAQVTGSGPGAGTGVTDPNDIDHNMKPMEAGTPPNPKPIDGALIKGKPVVPAPRMKRNKGASTTTTTTIITTTTVGSFR